MKLFLCLTAFLLMACSDGWNNVTVAVHSKDDTKIYADGQLVTILGFGVPGNDYDTIAVPDGAQLDATVYKTSGTLSATETARDGLSWDISADLYCGLGEPCQ